MSELRHVIKNPIVLSAREATGGAGGSEDGYDVVFVTGGDTVWIEKTAFEEAFGAIETAEDLTFPSALAILQEGIEVEREAQAGQIKLIEFKKPERFNYVNDAMETVEVADPRGITYKDGNQIPVTRFMHINCYQNLANARPASIWEATSRDLTANDWKVVD